MRNFKYKILGFGLLAGLTLFSSIQQVKLDKMRNELGINDADDIKDKSPSVVFTTIALGSFRGFIANLLFLRSNRMQEERRYYEVHQLAKWIRALQPKFTGAIAFMAWNMSYNISVTFDTPQERWVWVRKGMELYRDAIRNHSGDPELYREYGWIYQHKMGMNLDDANRLYKREWAILMVRMLKENPDLEKLSRVTCNPNILHNKLAKMGFPDFIKLIELRKNALPKLEDDSTAYDRLANAVINSEDNELPETVAKYIKEDKLKEEIVKYILQCERKRWDYETLKYLLNDFIDFDKVLDSIEDGWEFEKLEERFRELGRLPMEFDKALALVPDLTTGIKSEISDITDSFLRDRWAWKEYILDVRKMWKINKEYGNLDWRVSETHAIYWALIGLEKEPDNVKCHRMVTQAMKDVVDRGKLLYFSSETHKNIDWTFNVDLVPKACEVIEEHIERLPEDRRQTFRTGYENFLKDCVHAFYASNRMKKAKEYADKLMNMFPSEKNKEYKNLRKIMTKELAENLESMNEDAARVLLQGYVDRSLQYQILYQSPEQGAYWWGQAKFVFDYFHNKTKTRKGRQGWNRPFYDMANDVYEAFKNRFPSTVPQAKFFFESMTANEPRKLDAPHLKDPGKKPNP